MELKERPQDLVFQKVLKRIIPDGSIFKMSYDLPYGNPSKVHIFMKYSALPTSRFTKFKMGDGSYEDGITLNVQIDVLSCKNYFDKEWENVKKTHNLPSRVWGVFEDHMWEKFRKTIGTEQIEVFYKDPDSRQNNPPPQ